MKAARRAARRLTRPRPESGFSMVEAMVAMTLAATILMSAAYAMYSGLNATVTTKLQQQATALGSEAIEVGREVEFDLLSMNTPDLVVATDSKLLTTCGGLAGTRFFDPDGPGPISCEQIVHTTSGGAVAPHVENRSVEGTPYVIKRYVTCTAPMTTDTPPLCPGVKRVVSIVEWTDRGLPKSLLSTTLVTRARRGLAVPKFVLTPTTQSKVVAHAGTVVFAHAIQNLGISDEYELTITVPGDRSWSTADSCSGSACIRLYTDVDANGIYDASTDVPQLTDTDGDGGKDVPPVAATEVFRFLIVLTVQGEGNDPAGAVNLPVVATSQTDGSVSRTATDTLFIGSTTLLKHLHNNPPRVGGIPPSSDTSYQFDMPMDSTAPTANSLVRYSVDAPNALGCANQLGRCIEPSTANESSDPSTNQNKPRIANWVMPVTSSTTLNGIQSVRIFVSRIGGACGGPFNFVAYLRDKATAAGTAGTLLGTVTSQTLNLTDLSGVCAPIPVTFDFTVVTGVIAAGRFLEVKLVLNASSVAPAMLSYDTTGFPATLLLQVAGA